MPPPETLRELALAKALLRRRIAVRRAQNVSLAAEAVRPLVWIDFAWACWREMSGLTKLAAIPLGLLVGRTVYPRVRFLLRLLRWAPWAGALIRAWRSRRAGGQGGR